MLDDLVLYINCVYAVLFGAAPIECRPDKRFNTIDILHLREHIHLHPDVLFGPISKSINVCIIFQ